MSSKLTRELQLLNMIPSFYNYSVLLTTICNPLRGLCICSLSIFVMCYTLDLILSVMLDSFNVINHGYITFNLTIVHLLTGIWGLKKNFALIELLEKLNLNVCKSTLKDVSSSSSPQHVVQCDEDDRHPADVYCTVCHTSLCQSCANHTHSSKTLSKHRKIPISERPKVNPACVLHPSHVLEFVCLEDTCRETPLMCYICKDYGGHKGHKHVLIQAEAESIRKSILNAVKHVKTFSGEVNEFAKKLAEITGKIEGKYILNQ